MIHKQCYYCREVTHRANLIQRRRVSCYFGFDWGNNRLIWCHKECYEEAFSAWFAKEAEARGYKKIDK